MLTVRIYGYEFFIIAISQEHEADFLAEPLCLLIPFNDPWFLSQTTPDFINKIFRKFSQFWSGKSSLQEVLDMPKANQDLGLFLGVLILTK